MIKVTPELLKNGEAFENVPESQLKWLIDNSRDLLLEAGEFLFLPGKPVNDTYIIIEGRIRLYLLQHNEMLDIYTFEAGSVTGNLPFSRGWTNTTHGQAGGDTQLLVLGSDKYYNMICTHYELTQAFVNVMTTRVRDYTSLQQQNEKMMSLGKLSAGLAHELNNPVSAVVRGATSLKEHIQKVRSAFQEIVSLGISREKIDLINGMLDNIVNNEDFQTLTLMERSEREDDLRDWLEDFDIENADDIAENFVEFNLTIDNAEVIKADMPEKELSAVFNWFSNSLVTEKIVKDISEGSKRIAGIVGAIKNFTHMDQGREKSFSDIHQGLKSTLSMLNYKIQKAHIKIIEHYDTTLPNVKAMVGELNQVWTNLIDNAIDAMAGNTDSILEITTSREEDLVCVTVHDNGSGIPEEVLTRIFDPFFTTKEIGKGTGLGLDVVQRIVKQHKGKVRVKSDPGNTSFLVCFPING
ncbi:sensor histidine kinase [Mucilaginibacter sp.]|uniref:sensor histidine kinase n=1 Tax=Mucilaginibacter sp. TaxID=1882438 RepID=UPI003568D941